MNPMLERLQPLGPNSFQQLLEQLICLPPWLCRYGEHCDVIDAPSAPSCIYERRTIMLYTVAVVLLILWLLGLVTSTTLGGFIHILLIIAVVVILLRVISGRRPL